LSTERPAAPRALCRDCLASFAQTGPGPRRCPDCGSPRVLSVADSPELTLAHVDCDAFYASVEKRDNPVLADKPLIVGGDGRRGVVSTACYIARTFGVRSAMPMARALKLCPHAVVLSPDMAKYSGVAREIRTLMFELTPLVEPISIDEAFLDLTGCEGVHGTGAASTLARFARRVEIEIGVTVSVGLSYCKFLAKLASEIDKPRGFATIGREEARARLAPLSVDRLWGVGKVAGQRLRSLGFGLIGASRPNARPRASRRKSPSSTMSATPPSFRERCSASANASPSG
jgi:DNA polymerase-4